MKSFTLVAPLFFLVALFATPSFGDYVERAGYDQRFGALEARDPEPKRRGGGSGVDTAPDASQSGVSATSTGNFAPCNTAKIAGVGIMAVVAGAAAMY